MQRFLYYICLLNLLLGIVPARAQQTPAYAWVWAGGSSNATFPVGGDCLAVDSDGNSYTAGFFFGTVTFGTETFVCQSQQYTDIYLAKHSPQGQLLWVKQLGGPQVKSAMDIAVDAAGNIYLTGSFYGPITIGTTTLIGRGDYFYDTFLAKFTPQGTLLWARQSSSAPWSYATGTSLAIDGAGNVLLAGTMSGQVQFDQFSLSVPPNNSLYHSENFLAYYTSQGVLQWVRTGFGTSNMSVATSSDGSVYIAGCFGASFTLGSYTLPSPPSVLYLPKPGLYLAKLDAQLNCLWVRYGFGDDAYPTSPSCSGLAVDPTSRGVVLSVVFAGPTTFDGHTFNCVGGCLPSNAYSQNNGTDALILKYNAQGSFLWSQQVGGPFSAAGVSLIGTGGTDVAFKPSIDVKGNSYVLLYLFAMPTLTTSIAALERWYPHLVSYTPAGSLRWTRPLSTAPSASVSLYSGGTISVVWSSTGYLYSTGYTQGLAQFDKLTVPLTGVYNAFTAKLTIPPDAALPPEPATRHLPPNIITPNGDGQNDAFVIEGPGVATGALTIYSRWGQQVFHTSAYAQDWDAPGLPAGLYYYLLQPPGYPAVKGWVEVVR